MCALLAPVATVAADLATTEALATRWTELRTETARLESDWVWQRRVLEASRDALKQQVGRLEADRDLLLASTATQRRELDERATQQAAQQQALASIEQELRTLSERAIALQRWLPPRLAAAVDLPLRSLADPSLPVAERMQYLANVQSRCHQFNRLVTASDEVLTPPGESQPRLIEVVYWGLAVAYGLDRERHTAYVGFPGAEAWTWEKAPDATASITRLLAIYREERPPEFVDVPIRVRDVTSARRR